MQNSFADDILKDIREFVGFFRSLWGLLAGGSLFFPFINLLVDAVPYPRETVRKESTTFALLGSAFVFLLIYMTRQLISQMDDANLRLPARMRYRRLPLAGHRSTVLAIIIFVLFIIVLADYLNAVWSSSYGIAAWSRSLLSGVFEYALIFIFATLAFSVLTTSEYMRQLTKVQNSQRRGWPSQETALSAIYMRLPEEERPKYLSELTVIYEVRSEQDGTPILEMTVKSKSGRPYEVKVDRSGNVLEFRRPG